MRGSGELVLAPLHSTWTSTALCQVVRQCRSDEEQKKTINYCFKPLNSQRQQRHFRAAGLLDVVIRSTGLCFYANGEVGWCCP